MTSVVYLIAKNSFREIIRDRVLYGLFIFALVVIFLSLVLGNLSFNEQQKITIDFGLTGIELSSGILAIFIGAQLVFRELELRTLGTILVRPVTLAQFLLGITTYRFYIKTSRL